MLESCIVALSLLDARINDVHAVQQILAACPDLCPAIILIQPTAELQNQSYSNFSFFVLPTW